MSEYSFGYDENGQPAGLSEQDMAKGPKWFRDYMDSARKQMDSMETELKALRSKDAKSELTDKFRAAGIDPGAVNAYAGEPDKVDDWLSANKGWLKPLDAAPEGGEQNQAPAGPPASTVSAEGQAGMQQMMEAGTQGVTPSQGSEAELVNRIANATPEEFAAIMKAQGSPFDWSGYLS